MGSNLGDRKATLDAAVSKIASLAHTRIIAVSSYHDTAPVGPPQPRYLNAAVLIETALDPFDLLSHLQRIENESGRLRTQRWGPRALDLDILLYEADIIDTPRLQIPHPLMHTRPFVMQPLKEIAPDAVHPVLKRTVAEIAMDLAENES